jgi:hypothetical protein
MVFVVLKLEDLEHGSQSQLFTGKAVELPPRSSRREVEA